MLNKFKILNKDGNAMYINDIDREICDLLGHEYDDKEYARFVKREECESDFDYYSKSNWFDFLGWQIAEGKSFQDIIDDMKNVMVDFIGKKDENDVLITIEYIYPNEMKVLNHWINSGYTPIQIIAKF